VSECLVGCRHLFVTPRCERKANMHRVFVCVLLRENPATWHRSAQKPLKMALTSTQCAFSVFIIMACVSDPRLRVASSTHSLRRAAQAPLLMPALPVCCTLKTQVSGAEQLPEPAQPMGTGPVRSAIPTTHDLGPHDLRLLCTLSHDVLK
jgi:hypothetical protein